MTLVRQLSFLGHEFPFPQRLAAQGTGTLLCLCALWEEDGLRCGRDLCVCLFIKSDQRNRKVETTFRQQHSSLSYSLFPDLHRYRDFRQNATPLPNLHLRPPQISPSHL